MFQFISVTGSCSFSHLGTVQERYHKEKRYFVFYSRTDRFNTRNNWTICRLIILYRYMLQMLCGMTLLGLFVMGALVDIKNVHIKVFILDILAGNRF